MIIEQIIYTLFKLNSIYLKYILTLCLGDYKAKKYEMRYNRKEWK